MNELQWEAVLIEKTVPPILQGSQENTSEDTTFEDKENTGNKWKHEMLIPLVMKWKSPILIQKTSKVPTLPELMLPIL